MSFANSHTFCGYKPVELHWPHRSHTDFHPRRICPCRAKATLCPRGTPGAPWGSSWRWGGFSLPWLWKDAVQQHVKVEMWYQHWVWAQRALCWVGKAPGAMPYVLAPWPPSNHLTFAFYIPHILLDNPISISLSDYFAFEKLNHHLPNFNSYNLFLWGNAEKGKNNEYFERCGSQTRKLCKRCL